MFEEEGYSYNAANRLYQRTWARGLVTTYTYDPDTGELTGVTYSNDPTNTPAVTYEYNRAGRLACVSDGAGEREFVYDPATLELTVEKLPHDFFGERDLVRGYGGPVGRMTALGTDTDGDGTIDGEYGADYDYDGTTGRMNHVSGPGLPAYGVVYRYLAETNPVEYVDYRTGSSESATILRAKRHFEDSRDLIDYVQNDWLISGTTTVSKYVYTNDALGRRDDVTRSGTASSIASGGTGDPQTDNWEYNPRNELTDSDRDGTSDPDGLYDSG